MRSRKLRVGLGTQLALVEGMIEGGTPWPTVEKELLRFVADFDHRHRPGHMKYRPLGLTDMHMATVVLALVRAGDLEAARRALKVLPVT